MVSSVGFFSHFPPFRNSSHNSSSSPAPFLAALAAGAVAVGLSLAASTSSFAEDSSACQKDASQIGWACLSLTNAGLTPVEPRTGEVFPQEVDGKRRLLGVGVRKTNVLGLKSIDVYAFGVYADDSDIKKLNGKYGKCSLSELKDKEELIADALDSNIRMTVRLQIVYGRLKIRSIRQAFAKSVGSRLQKFSASESTNTDELLQKFSASESTNTDELLQKFVSLFKDDEKVPKGSVIELSREEGSVLRTRINGKEVGQIQSKLLCKSILDLYFGEEPFDKKAKEDIQLNLASRLKTT